MSKKAVLITVGSLVLIILFLVVRAWMVQQDLVREAMRPEHRDRYFDTSAITESNIKMDRPNANVDGVVVNNTWKTRNVGVWVGFVKSDGFHQGGTTGRNYFGYQYFPQVPPKEKRTFSIPIGVPPLNRSWSVVAEFDPNDQRLRPIWAPGERR